MKVENIMNKNPFTVTPSSSFRDAAKLIYENHISGLPVINNDNECIGIISEKDLLKSLFPTYNELFQVDNETPLYTLNLENLEKDVVKVNHLKVEDLMSKEIIMVDPATPILEAASMMIVYRVRRLPVIENKKLVGIISQGDVFRAILKKELGFK